MAETPPLPPLSPVTMLPPVAHGDVRAALVETPESLQQVARPVHIEGTVRQTNRDGSVTVATDQGDITIAFRPPRILPPGQPVEVDIPAGNPPRAAVLRVVDAPPAPSSQVPVPQTPSLPASTPTIPRVDQLPPRPLPVEALPAQPQSFILENGQPVRLIPLPPGETVLPALPQQTMDTVPGRMQIPPALPVLIPEARNLLPPARPLSVPSLPNATPVPLLQNPSAQNLPLSGPAFFNGALPPSSPFALPVSLTPSPLGLVPPASFQGLPAFGPFTIGSNQVVPGNVMSGEPVLFQSGGYHLGKMDIRVQSMQPSFLPMIFAAKSLTALFSAPLFAGQSFATVEGFTGAGLPVLSLTSSGTIWPQSFVMQFPASNVTPGARIVFTPQMTLTPAVSPAATPASLDLLPGPEWPVLEELATTFAQTAPQALQAFAHIAPNPSLPAQLPAAALLFLVAVRSGDPELWLGNKAEILRRADKTELLTRLAGDMNTVNKFSSDPAIQDWKAFPMPLYYDGQFQKAMLWFRQDGGRQDLQKADGARTTRFIFDLNLTRMGAVQLDGLAKTDRIDLIVRTQKFISPEMRQAMRRKYMHVLDQANFTGDLSFQDSQDKFVTVTAG